MEDRGGLWESGDGRRGGVRGRQNGVLGCAALRMFRSAPGRQLMCLKGKE